MADLTRADELVQAMDRDDAFRAEIEAAPTVTAKRTVLDARGFEDVGLDDMRAYVESKGAKLATEEGGRELSDQELAAVAGGALTETEMTIVGGVGIGVGVALAAASV